MCRHRCRNRSPPPARCRPLPSACACGRCSLASSYCAGSPSPAGVALLQRKQIIRLRGRNQPVAFERAHDRRHRAAVGNAPAVQRRVVSWNGWLFDARQAGDAAAARRPVACSRCESFDHDLVRHQRRSLAGGAPLGRCAAAVGWWPPSMTCRPVRRIRPCGTATMIPGATTPPPVIHDNRSRRDSHRHRSV